MAAVTIGKEQLLDYCQRNRIRRLALFGSVLRNDFGRESDVDVLVEFEPGASVGFFRLHALEQELSKLLGGRRVDLNTPQMLSTYFRARVQEESQVLYEAA